MSDACGPRHALVVAAIGSGSGKTTICNGLLRALSRRGLRCAPFKTGPDYIDPYFHRLACGRESENLDLFMASPSYAERLFARHARGADVAVVEGVMGLFDGYDCRRGSAAEIAALTGAPVVLVIDARSTAYSLAAVIAGFRTFDPDVRICGVIFNNVGSPAHSSLLLRAAADGGVPCLGLVPRTPGMQTPSRHLGLAMDNTAEIEAYLECAAGVVENNIDIGRLLALTLRDAADTQAPAEAPADMPGLEALPDAGQWSGRTVAIARDEAFNFLYPANVRALRNLVGPDGRVVEFSPLADTAPPDADMLYFPGGYPELYADRLAANRTMIEGVRRHAEHGGMIYGECGGLLYLSEALDSTPMCGLLPFRATMRDARLTLGYRSVRIGATTIRGHEFHYSRLENPDDLPSIAQQTDVHGRPAAARLYRRGRVVGGYTHLYWGETPAARDLFDALFPPPGNI